MARHTPSQATQAVAYARVSSKEQEKEGFSIPAQQKLLSGYASDHGFQIAREFVDIETAKRAGRTSFGEMIAYLKRTRTAASFSSRKRTACTAICAITSPLMTSI